MVFGTIAAGPAVEVHVDVGHPSTRPVSRYLTGACLEDVNHEVYGGLYSQMVFGESFQEPAVASPVAGFAAFGGTWAVDRGELAGSAGDGPKLIGAEAGPVDGEVGVEVYLPGADGGNAGLLVRADKCGVGADAFDGYEVSLDAAAKTVRLGRHRHDYHLLGEGPCDLSPDKWASLVVRLDGPRVEVRVDGKVVLSFDDPHAAVDALAGTCSRQRVLWPGARQDGKPRSTR